MAAKGVWILRRLVDREHAAYLAEQGEVLVAEEVVGFKKIKLGTLENVGSGEVELPQQEMQTTAAWLTVTPETLASVRASREELIDGLRAVTYLLHHLAPIFLLCDIRDLGSWLGDTTPADPSAVATRESAKRRLDRKSGVEGKRGDLGGRRIIKKKKNNTAAEKIYGKINDNKINNY